MEKSKIKWLGDDLSNRSNVESRERNLNPKERMNDMVKGRTVPSFLVEWEG